MLQGSHIWSPQLWEGGGIDEGDEGKEGGGWVVIDVMWEKLMKVDDIS